MSWQYLTVVLMATDTNLELWGRQMGRLWAIPTQAKLGWDCLSINLAFSLPECLGVLRVALPVGNNCITINLQLESLPGRLI